MKKEILERIENIIDTNSFVLGEDVKKFEENFANYCEVGYGVGVSSGTGALKLALGALGVGFRDEVIIPANTFIATAEAVSHVGATPVFVDIDPKTHLIDHTKIAEQITEKTKAIIPVHLFGQMADMDEILDIAKENNLFVVEDASQAHGAEYKGKRAGSLGDVGCFSFYPGKNIGAFGEAGICVTNSKEIAEGIQLLRNHGVTEKYVHALIGCNDKMHSIQAAVLDVKLKHLDTWNELRKNAAALYKKHLADNSNVTMIQTGKDRTNVYHVLVIECDDRDAVQKKLGEAEVGTNIHYPIPIHLQEAYAHLGFKKGDYPNTEKASQRILSLPMFPEISDEEVTRVCDVLNSITK